MGIFLSQDKRQYRRWVHFFPALLLPGSPQFLSGQRKAAFLWLAFYYLTVLVVLAVCLYPGTPYAAKDGSALEYLILAPALGSFLASLRHPIPVLGFKKGLFAFVCIAGILLAPPIIVRNFLFQPFQIPSNSMAPTLRGAVFRADGSLASSSDCLFVNRFIYSFTEPKRGDVIAFEREASGLHASRGKLLFISRVVGLPGERIGLQPPFLLINGEKADDPPFFRRMGDQADGLSGYAFLPQSAYLKQGESCLLKDDEYFVMGDNSPNSADSRIYGPIKRSAIFGKASYLYAPAARKGPVR